MARRFAILTIVSTFIAFVLFTSPSANASRGPEIPSAKTRTPSFDDIVTSVKATSAKGQETAAAVLENLKRSFPEYFDDYVMSYASRSLQQSSRSHPRVILHGNGQTFLAFNGDPSHRGYGNLELIEFKGAAGYEFRSIRFTNESSSIPVEDGEIEETIGSIQISKANPAICLKCHGSTPRPIWDAYAIWPGFYGADADRLFYYGKAKSSYAPYDGPDLETPAWIDLKANYKANARFKLLDGVLARNRVLGNEKDRVNLNLNRILSSQMATRLLVGLEKNEEALETIGAINGCRSYRFPTQLTATNKQRLKELLDRQRKHFERTNGTYSPFAANAIEFMSGDEFTFIMTAYDRAFAKYANLDIRDFSYSRERDINLQDGDGGLRPLATKARELLKQNFGREIDFRQCSKLMKRLE